MGLDIYLYKYDNYEDTVKREAQYSEQSEANWKFDGKSYNDLTEEQKSEARKKDDLLAESLGLDKYGSDKTSKKSIEINSKKYPEHYFKIGYFRSSYNEGGIERVLRNIKVPGLNEIFEPGEEYDFKPDWEKSLNKVILSINELSEIMKKGDDYRCVKFTYNEFSGDPNTFPIDSEEKAMELFLNEKKRNENRDSEGYSNNSGEFYFKEPLKITGIINGVNKRFFVDQKLPCCFLITKSNGLSWYLEALEIVKETIEFVISDKDKNKYYLHWSS